jgi:hypothetical protein
MRKRENSLNEGGLARSFQKKKGKLPLARQPSRARVRGADVIFSVRFSAAELEQLRQRAAAQGIAISALIRNCVFRSGETAEIDWINVPYQMGVYSPSRFAMLLSKPLAKITVQAPRELKGQWNAETTTSSTALFDAPQMPL